MMLPLCVLFLVCAVSIQQTCGLPDAFRQCGCKSPSDCPKNANCVSGIDSSSDCGACMCSIGYKRQGQTCVSNKDNNNNNGGGGGDDGASLGAKKADKKGGTAVTTTEKSITTTGQQSDDSNNGPGSSSTSPQQGNYDSSTTTASNPIIGSGGSGGNDESSPSSNAEGPENPGPKSSGGGGLVPVGPVQASEGPLQCSDYACQPTLPAGGGSSSGGGGGAAPDEGSPLVAKTEIVRENAACKRKLVLPAVECTLAGGGKCYGEACLNGLCICPPYKVDRQCTVDKPGKCESATGQPKQGGVRKQNKRLIHKTNPDSGGIIGRHFANSLQDCIKLGQWYGQGCKGVNYGTLDGKKVCELLSIPLNTITLTWFTDSSGWEFVQCN